MKQNALILFGLGIVVIGSVLLTTANAQQDPCFPAFIAVPGGQSRAALEGSDFPGTWTFTIESVKGNISKVEIQIYENALPTSGEDPDLYMVCASNPDPFGRPQVACGATVPVGHNIQAGAVSIKRVKVGSSGSLTLDEGVYCVRPLAFGKGEVTISVHPH
jgi:hypothetical protein